MHLLRRVLPYACCFAAIAFTYFYVHTALSKLDREGTERRNDTCLTFEGAYLQEVTQLQRTYDFLAPMSRHEQLSTPLNRAILKGLAKQELDVRSDLDYNGARVPRYCDAPNVGLPEPDPKPPKRPRGLALGG